MKMRQAIRKISFEGTANSKPFSGRCLCPVPTQAV